jgi:hypothetical protein
MAASIVRRRALINIALRRSPIRSRNNPSDVSGFVMAIVFLERDLCQYQCKWRTPNSIVDPVAGHVNSRIAERKILINTKHKSLLNLDFFRIAGQCVIEIAAKTIKKITIKTNSPGAPLLTPKATTRRFQFGLDGAGIS